MPDHDVSDSELRSRDLEHTSANATTETTCPYNTCEGPYRTPQHHQECCLRIPYLPCKHDVKDLADMRAGKRLVHIGAVDVRGGPCVRPVDVPLTLSLFKDACSSVDRYFSRRKLNTWQELDGQETQGPTQRARPVENAQVKEYLQNRPQVIFADSPEVGMYPCVGHILYPHMRAMDDSMIERAPGVTSEDIHQHRVCGVPSVSFNGDCTKLTPFQDVVYFNDHS